jgi:hypothetical protein
MEFWKNRVVAGDNVHGCPYLATARPVVVARPSATHPADGRCGRCVLHRSRRLLRKLHVAAPATSASRRATLATCRWCCARDCRLHAALSRPRRRSCRGCRGILPALQHSLCGCADYKTTYWSTVRLSKKTAIFGCNSASVASGTTAQGENYIKSSFGDNSQFSWTVGQELNN